MPSHSSANEELQSQFRPKHLFHFCETWDTKLLYTLGTLAAIFQGVCMPCLSIFFGTILSETAGTSSGTATLSNRTSSTAEQEGTTTGSSNTLVLFLLVSVGMFFSGFVNYICFNVGADRQVLAFRQSYLRNVLFLDMRDYDGLDVHGVPTSMGQHTNALKDASGQQLGTFVASVCQFFAGLTIALFTSWEMALVLVAVMHVL